MMKKYVAVLLAIGLLTLPAQAAVTGAPDVDAQAAVLMEKETGAILYEFRHFSSRQVDVSHFP